jgi:molybdate transport system ATP-binding protein
MKIDSSFISVKDFEICFSSGEWISIFGTSGSGKTTFLKSIAGLISKNISKKIIFENQVWEDTKNKIFIQPYKRNIGFVFQEFALFPSLTILQNLIYTNAQNEKKAKEYLERLNLESKIKKYPQELSGGEKQRVAILRAILHKPKLLLLDEPFSALDDVNKKLVFSLLKDYRKENFSSAILVSHDKADIQELTERVYNLDRYNP